MKSNLHLCWIRTITLFLCIFFTNSVFATYPYRDISKPPIELDPEVQIFHLSAGRSGSTLIYNILKYLFEEVDCNIINQTGKVVKTHVPKTLYNERFSNKKIILSTTRRDPMNIVASQRRVRLRFDKVRDPLADLDFRKLDLTTILYFKYEEFQNNNFEYIFNVIESGLSIEIPVHEKEKIIQLFSTEKMKAIQQKFQSFKYYDPVTAIHGNHIFNTNWQSFFSLRAAKRIYSLNKELREEWGYPPINVEKEWRKFRQERDCGKK